MDLLHTRRRASRSSLRTRPATLPCWSCSRTSRPNGMCRWQVRAGGEGVLAGRGGGRSRKTSAMYPSTFPLPVPAGWDARDLDANFTFVSVSHPWGDVAKFAQGWCVRGFGVLAGLTAAVRIDADIAPHNHRRVFDQALYERMLPGEGAQSEQLGCSQSNCGVYIGSLEYGILQVGSSGSGWIHEGAPAQTGHVCA